MSLGGSIYSNEYGKRVRFDGEIAPLTEYTATVTSYALGP